MSDTNFTKGPWKVSHVTDGMRIDSEHCEGIAYIDIYGAEQAGLVEADATARLIAAAPELLKALQSVPNLISAKLAEQSAAQSSLRASFDGDSGFEDRCDARAKAANASAQIIEAEINAVIAKATFIPSAAESLK